MNRKSLTIYFTKEKTNHDKQTDAAKLLEMKVNKKLLQEHLKISTGKVATIKYMTNVQTEIHQTSNSNNLETLVQCLKDMEGISPLHKKLVYSSLSIQVLHLNITPMTKKCLQMQHINEFCMPLYLLLIVDDNGQSGIIGMYLTTQETQEAIIKMVRYLKSHNLYWTITRVTMRDKDFAE